MSFLQQEIFIGTLALSLTTLFFNLATGVAQPPKKNKHMIKKIKKYFFS